MERTLMLGAWLAGAGLAQAAAPALPPLTLTDRAGAAATETTLKQAGPWTMVVVDAERPLTATLLSRLQKKEGDWGGRVVVVAIGTSRALEDLATRQPKLTGVRWYRDTSGQLLKQLQLPGVPAVLGIRADNSIGWQSLAVPAQPEATQAMVNAWLTNGGP
jgi:hypothetical protein